MTFFGIWIISLFIFFGASWLFFKFYKKNDHPLKSAIIQTGVAAGGLLTLYFLLGKTLTVIITIMSLFVFFGLFLYFKFRVGYKRPILWAAILTSLLDASCLLLYWLANVILALVVCAALVALIVFLMEKLKKVKKVEEK